MFNKFLMFLIVSFMLILASRPGYAIVMLSFNPSSSNVSLNDTFSVDLIADIPDTQAINSWGLDLAFDAAVLSLDSFTKAPIWTGGLGSCALDSDEICGYALVPSISGISTLGTFNFTAIGVGSTALNLSATDGDITEGFRLSIAGIPIIIPDWGYTPGQINVRPAMPVPEPAVLALVLLGLAGLGISRRKV